MPFGDRTGPRGQGPMTGRGMGYCAGHPRPGYGMYPYVRGFGRGRGWGQGYGRRYYPASSYRMTVSEEKEILQSEKEALENEVEVLKEEMKIVEKRIKELKK